MNTGIETIMVETTTTRGMLSGYTDAGGNVNIGPFIAGEVITVNVEMDGYDNLQQQFVASSSVNFMMLGMNPTVRILFGYVSSYFNHTIFSSKINAVFIFPPFLE